MTKSRAEWQRKSEKIRNPKTGRVCGSLELEAHGQADGDVLDLSTGLKSSGRLKRSSNNRLMVANRPGGWKRNLSGTNALLSRAC